MNITGIIMVVVLLLVMLLIGAWASKRIKNTEDYWAGGRKLGRLVTACTIIATSVGGGMTLSWIGMGYTNGIGAFYYGAVQGIGGLIAAAYIVKPFRAGKYISLPDFFHDIYHNKVLTILISLVALIAPITWACGQFAAAATMIEAVLGIPFKWAVIGFGLVIIAYSTGGGFMAVAYTDTFQWLVMVVLWIVVMPMPFIEVGGVGQLMQTADPALLSWNPFTIPGYAWFAVPSWIIMGFTTSMGMQSTYQRIAGAKDAATAKFGLRLNSCVCVLFALLAAYVGICISTMQDGLGGNTAFTWFLSNRVPQFFAMAYLVVVLMATSSSADSMLNTFALNVSQDIYKKFVNPNASDKKALNVGMLTTLIFGLVSIYWALNNSGLIVTIFGLASNLSSAPLVGVMYLTIFGKNVRTDKGMIAGLCTGVAVGFLFSTVIKSVAVIPSGASMFAVFSTIIVGYVVSLATRGPGGTNVAKAPHEELEESQAADSRVTSASLLKNKKAVGYLFFQALCPWFRPFLAGK